MEAWIEKGNAAAGDRAWTLSSDTTDRGPKRANKRCGDEFRKMFRSESFKATSDLVAGMLGVHSIGKLAAPFAARWGMSAQETETRGRWKGGNGDRLVTRVCTLPDQPHMDAKVASALANGEPAACEVHPPLVECLTDDWLRNCVTPCTHQCRGPTSDGPSALLAKPLPWACFDARFDSALDVTTRSRVASHFCSMPESHPKFPEDWNMSANPIVKTKSHAWRQGTDPRFTKIGRCDQDGTHNRFETDKRGGNDGRPIELEAEEKGITARSCMAAQPRWHRFQWCIGCSAGRSAWRAPEV